MCSDVIPFFVGHYLNAILLYKLQAYSLFSDFPTPLDDSPSIASQFLPSSSSDQSTISYKLTENVLFLSVVLIRSIKLEDSFLGSLSEAFLESLLEDLADNLLSKPLISSAGLSHQIKLSYNNYTNL